MQMLTLLQDPHLDILKIQTTDEEFISYNKKQQQQDNNEKQSISKSKPTCIKMDKTIKVG